MIIKQADDKLPEIRELQALLVHAEADANTKKCIEQQIRNIQAGVQGEQEAAYEMRVHWGESQNWMIIHDLRIEHNGLVAQIDHLLMNRFLEIWVCESKSFSEGIGINEYGEFSAFFGGKPYEVASPIEQNKKHMLILQRLFDSGRVKLPTRLGLSRKPTLAGLVLVSKKARISRPKEKIDELACIVKNDQLFSLIDKKMNDSNLALIAKLIGQDTLEELAKTLAQEHRPAQFNWAAKFGLTASGSLTQTADREAASHSTAESTHSAAKPIELATQEAKQKLICNACGVSLTYNVAKFCWFNKSRFSGNIYCMRCQKEF